MLLAHLKKRIYLSKQEFDGNELRYVQEAFMADNIATSGSFIKEFEEKLEERFDGGNVVALNSGTSAIHLALILLGIKRGDEVICQSLTFAASANPIVYLDARPIFVDSEKDTWNMCPQLLEEAILDRISKGRLPKAIIPVNLFGMPAKLPEITEVAFRYGIPVLEDAAESLGSKIGGKYCGTFGDIGIFSFNGNKVITTGGGGAIVTENVKWTKKARHLSTQAKDRQPHYEHSAIGYNYKMNNLAAGIGIAQLEGLESQIQKRRAVFLQYRRELETIPGISFLEEPKEYFSNRWLTTLLIDPKRAGFDKDAVRLALERQNIESRPIWKPMNLQPVFQHALYYGGTVAADLFEQGICLPSSGSLSGEDIERVRECFHMLHQEVIK